MKTLGYEDGLRECVRFVEEITLDGTDPIACHHLLEKPIPKYIRNGIESLALKHMREKNPLMLRKVDYINLEHPDIHAAIENLEKIMVRHVLLSAAEVATCIKNTLKFRLELLIHPQQAIEKVYFLTCESAEKNAILKSIEKFGEKLPFLSALQGELDEWLDSKVPLSDFRQICDRICETLYVDIYQRHLWREIDDLYQFFNVNGTPAAYAIDITLLEDFLHYRKLATALETVHLLNTVQGVKHLAKENLLKILRESFPVPTFNFVPENTTNRSKTSSLRITYDKDDSNFKIHVKKIESQPPPPYPSISEFICPKDREILVRKIFKRNEMDFQNFILRIDKLDKWRDAKKIIDWEVESRKLDPYSREAVRLGDVVFARYFSYGAYT